MGNYVPREMTPEWLASIRDWVARQFADDDDPGNVWVKLAEIMADLLAEVDRLKAIVRKGE